MLCIVKRIVRLLDLYTCLEFKTSKPNILHVLFFYIFRLITAVNAHVSLTVLLCSVLFSVYIAILSKINDDNDDDHTPLRCGLALHYAALRIAEQGCDVNHVFSALKPTGYGSIDRQKPCVRYCY